jgi:hypothetical protein
MPDPRSKKKASDKEEDASSSGASQRADRSLSYESGSEMLALQRALGNKTFGRLLEQAADQSGGSGFDVGEPGDKYEQEADRVAGQLVTNERGVSGETETGVGGPETRAAGPGSSGGSSGQPLSEPLRSYFETRLGTDLSGVRLHTDSEAEASAEAMGARAVTVGQDITFGPGQYAPNSRQGLHLLGHELTHVAQQGSSRAGVSSPVTKQSGAPQVQGSFFGDIWKGIKSVGSAIGKGLVSAGRWIRDRAKDVGKFITGAAGWLGERLRDAAMWAVNLVRDLPARIGRLATTLIEGLSGVVTFIPEAIRALASGGLKGFASWLWEKAKKGGAWVLTLLSRVFDVLGGPEAFEFIMHLLTKARPLTPEEITAASSVLGPGAVRWGDVRVSEGGVLAIVFALNNDRAFTTFHTINLAPNDGIDVVVHELTHVYQYERAGGVYIGQAIHAQATVGYGYGGGAGLVADKAAGKHYRDYNREQQAQIAQDYYNLVIVGGGTSLSADQQAAYQFFIGELRAGDL